MTLRKTKPYSPSMFAKACAALLIVGLLLCPYRCMGGIGAACADGGARPECSCCQHCHPTAVTGTQHGERPESPRPADDCGCSTCLCKGAVLSQKALLADLDACCWWATDAQPASDVASTVGDSLVRFAGDDMHSIALSGRALRLVIESLQV